MPKLKTNRSAAKRFSKTKTGKVKRKHAFTGHILGPKDRKRKRKLRAATLVSTADMGRISSMLHG